MFFLLCFKISLYFIFWKILIKKNSCLPLISTSHFYLCTFIFINISTILTLPHCYPIQHGLEALKLHFPEPLPMPTDTQTQIGRQREAQTVTLLFTTAGRCINLVIDGILQQSPGSL